MKNCINVSRGPSKLSELVPIPFDLYTINYVQKQTKQQIDIYSLVHVFRCTLKKPSHFTKIKINT